MGLRPTVTSRAGGVETYIDTAYDKIQNVSDNMAALLALNEQFVNLEGIYLGQFATSPIQRGDTTPLKNGDHFLNTAANTLYFYLEGNWINYKVFYTQDALNTAVGQGPFNIWVAYADDVAGAGISVNPANKKYIGFANNRTTSTVSIDNAGVFTWSKYVGDNAYVHFAFADNITGTNNFNYTSGDYIGHYSDNTETDSADPTDYNWVQLRGTDGTDVTVADLGGGRISITGANGTVFLDDGEVPTLIDNGDGTFTITSGNESIIVSDGVTPLNGIDYFDGNSGNYISFVFAQVDFGDPIPTIDVGSGTYNGTVETYPTGASWTDNAVYSDGKTTYMSKNSYVNDKEAGTWTLSSSSWSAPTIFMDTTPSVPQIQVTGFAFLRSASVLTVAPTGGSYANPTPDGWFDGIPNGSLPIYVVSVIFTSDGLAPQPAGSPVTWNTPELLAESGQGFKHRFSENINGPWSDTPTVNARYMITSVRGSDGIWTDDVANPILIKGETGTAPQAQLKSYCFKRSSDPTFLETPTGGSFASPNPVDGAVTGWSDGIPAGNDILYVSTRTFTSDGLSPHQVSWAQSQIFTYNGESFRMQFSIDGSTNWHTEPTPADEYMQAQTSADRGTTWVNSGDPVKIKGENGTPGTSVASLSIYRRYLVPGVPIPTPVGGSFSFTTLTVSDMPANWNISVPSGTDPIYISQVIAQAATIGGVDSSLPWGQPELLAESGGTADDGDSVYQANLFRRSPSAPPNVADNTATYNFGSNTFTTLPTDWYDFIPAGTDPVYVITATFSISGNTGSDATQTWTTPVLYVSNGLTIYKVYSYSPDGSTDWNTDLRVTDYWRREATVTDGSQGAWSTPVEFVRDGSTIYEEYQYSIDGATLWHDDYVTDDIYRRTRTVTDGVGATWSGSAVITGHTPAEGTDYFIKDGSFKSNVYKTGTASSTPPNDGTFDGSLETQPTGWSDNPTFTSGQDTYVSTGIYEHNAVANTWALNADGWSASVVYSREGYTPIEGTDFFVKEGSFKSFVFRTEAAGYSTPPTNTGTFDGTTEVAPTGWADDPYFTTGEVTFVSSATYVNNPVTGTWAITGSWSTPAEYSEKGDEGTPGLSTYHYPIFRRHATGAGITPSGGSFNFGTNVATPPANWFNTPPAVNGDPLYVSYALASIVGDTATDSSLTWSTPEIYTVDGTNGVPTFKSTVFIRGASTPTNTTGGSWATPLPNADGTLGAWSDGIPAGALQLWASTRIFTEDGLAPQQVSWTTPIALTDTATITYLYSVDGSTAWHSTATVNDVYMSIQVITNGIAGPIEISKIKGEDGNRGSRHYYGTTTSGPLSDANFAIDALAIIASAGDTEQNRDTVTISDVGNAYAETKYYDGATWIDVVQVIDGNLIVHGTIGADQIDTDAITIGKIDTVSVTPAALGAEEVGVAAAYTDAREIIINAYADGAVTVEETRAIQDAIDRANEAAGISLVSSAPSFVSAVGSTIKSVGTSTWTQGVYSNNGFVGGAHISWVNDTVGARYMLGLNADPLTDHSFPSIDYALYAAATAYLSYENGGFTETLLNSVPAKGDLCEVIYDGVEVKYIINGIVRRTVAAPAALNLYLDSSFTDTDSTLYNVAFFPLAGQNTSAKTAGTVGGWGIVPASLHTLDNEYTGTGFSNLDGITLKSVGSLHSKNFYIDVNGDAGFKGALTATSLTLEGTTVDYGDVANGPPSNADATDYSNTSINNNNISKSQLTSGGKVYPNQDDTVISSGVSYVPGVSGWAIDSSGNAEFGNAIIRGNITATSLTLEGATLPYTGVTGGPPSNADATNYSDTRIDNSENTAASVGAATEAYVNTAESDAVTAASADATTKANTAQSNAESTASSDATTKANTAETNAATNANNAAKNAGTVGGWMLNSDAIFSGGSKYSGTGFSDQNGMTLRSVGSIHAKDFYVDSDGSAGFSGKLEIGTTGNESGNASGVAMTLDPYSPTPFEITRTSDSKRIFGLDIIAGEEKVRIDGRGGPDFIDDVSGISLETRTAINKYYLGEGATAPGTTGSQASGTSNSVTIATVEAGQGVVTLSYDFSASNTYTGPTNQVYVQPIWTIRINRDSSGGELLHETQYEGSFYNYNLFGTYTCNYNINCVGSFTDKGAPLSGTETYVVTITRNSTSGNNPTSLTRNKFSALTPAFNTNTWENFDTITETLSVSDTATTGNEWQTTWTDKDTGFTIKSGRASIIGTGDKWEWVDFDDAFTEVSSVNISDEWYGSDNNYGSVIGVEDGRIKLRNRSNTTMHFRWIATGYTALP